MILLDLKLTLFVLVLGFCCILGSIWWFDRRMSWSRGGVGTMLQVIDTLPVGVMVRGQDGVPIICNGVVHRLLGSLAEIQTDAADQLLRHINDAGRSGTPRNGLLTQPLAIRWWHYPLADQHSLLVLADATDQQQFARQQQAFIGQLSHELRTPLTALATHTEIMRDPQTPEPVYQASLATVQRETQRMARLVRDLLELHRLETADDLPLQLTDVVLVAEDALAQTILAAEERGLHLVFDADAHLEPVLAHPDRLKQVFLNVLDNAVKHCRPGDTIKVCLEAQPSGVHCVVQDTGPGIAPGDLPRVTERLYRGHTNTEGSGIGLALVKEILHRHHATLDIQSSTERGASGTTVGWRLPYVTVTTTS